MDTDVLWGTVSSVPFSRVAPTLTWASNALLDVPCHTDRVVVTYAQLQAWLMRAPHHVVELMNESARIMLTVLQLAAYRLRWGPTNNNMVLPEVHIPCASFPDMTDVCHVSRISAGHLVRVTGMVCWMGQAGFEADRQGYACRYCGVVVVGAAGAVPTRCLQVACRGQCFDTLSGTATVRCCRRICLKATTGPGVIEVLMDDSDAVDVGAKISVLGFVEVQPSLAIIAHSTCRGHVPSPHGVDVSALAFMGPDLLARCVSAVCPAVVGHGLAKALMLLCAVERFHVLLAGRKGMGKSVLLQGLSEALPRCAVYGSYGGGTASEAHLEPHVMAGGLAAGLYAECQEGVVCVDNIEACASLFGVLSEAMAFGRVHHDLGAVCCDVSLVAATSIKKDKLQSRIAPILSNFHFVVPVTDSVDSDADLCIVEAARRRGGSHRSTSLTSQGGASSVMMSPPACHTPLVQRLRESVLGTLSAFADEEPMDASLLRHIVHAGRCLPPPSLSHQAKELIFTYAAGDVTALTLVKTLSVARARLEQGPEVTADHAVEAIEIHAAVQREKEEEQGMFTVPVPRAKGMPRPNSMRGTARALLMAMRQARTLRGGVDVFTKAEVMGMMKNDAHAGEILSKLKEDGYLVSAEGGGVRLVPGDESNS